MLQASGHLATCKADRNGFVAVLDPNETKEFL
jgi:hypothetical protein